MTQFDQTLPAQRGDSVNPAQTATDKAQGKPHAAPWTSTLVLGHYARPTKAFIPTVERETLSLFAALAAIEVSARLGRYLPISVSSANLHGRECLGFSDKPIPQSQSAQDRISHWSSWDDAALRNSVVHNALAALSSSGDTEAADCALAVELTDRPVQLQASHPDVAVRILCRIGDGTLLITTLCDKADPWAPACNALAEMYAEILHELLTDPGITPAQTRGISAPSQAWVLGELSGHSYDHGAYVPIPTLIERVTDADPERTAYRFAERTLSYRHFDCLANALASQLAARGVGHGAVIAVLMSNCLEMPVAYQALMKLGAAFVPLDPAWPQERLQQTLGIVGGCVLVCTDTDAVPSQFKADALPVDIDKLIACTDRPAAATDIQAQDAIYGIFTSGTTGNPKCAMNNHGGLLNRFRFMSRYFNGGDGVERVLQNSKHTFDSSFWQLFWPLTTGGQVVIPQQGAYLNLETTIDTIARHAIAMTDFVPSVFNQVVALAERSPQIRAKLATLRELVVGGEEITPQMVHKLRSILPQLRVSNAYGPTETSIGMVFHPVQTVDGMHIPLGRPIDNCHVVIADEALRPLPQGACGEILIGGACVGNGYLKEAGKTAAVFIDNRFAAIAGPHLYRSGDLGYFDEQGRLRFSGRRDFQVKIGGVRIELGEIESVAERCPYVHQAKALVSSGDVGKALALFVTGAAGLQLTALEQSLRTLLPRHSMPRHIFILPQMPLTENAKADRRKLQQQLDEHVRQQTIGDGQPADGAAPQSALDRVAGVFRKVLGRPELSVDDHFFEAGGDSLQAVEAVMALEQACGVKFGVQDLFECPSAGLAHGRIGELQRKSAASQSDVFLLMDRDAACGAGLVGAAVTQPTPLTPRRIFLTGATGFVGGYLARQLLAHDDTEVYALCRGSDDPQAQLVDSLVARGLWRKSFAGRLHAVHGSLAEPQLGLGAQDWQRLAESCDCIVHCAALVNFLYDYQAHRPPNVLGTQALLRLATEQGHKPLHFISTLGTLDKHAALQSEPLAETFHPAQAIAPSSGYSRSKWVAERLLLAARERGASVTLYRLGEVMPCGELGLPNQRALTHFLLSAIVQIGAKPDVALRSDWSPVDDVARRVIAAVLDHERWNSDYHVFRPGSVCFGEALERTGMRLKTLSCKDWTARLELLANDAARRELSLLCRFLPGSKVTEEAMREAFGKLLTDNPRLFLRGNCGALESAHALPDGDLEASITAYSRTLQLAKPGRLHRVI